MAEPARSALQRKVEAPSGEESDMSSGNKASAQAIAPTAADRMFGRMRISVRELEVMGRFHTEPYQERRATVARRMTPYIAPAFQG
ncbi:hypothetical protein [uncultured Sphingomonas sp.]|uniref:hypothetical protein n=1 Tax=uncultured Sphingomonas sp. TaxID=158754 RepID=UPI0035CA0E3C